MLRLWNRLIAMPDNRSTVLLGLLNNSPWARELVLLFFGLGSKYIFTSCTVMLVIMNLYLKCIFKNLKKYKANENWASRAEPRGPSVRSWYFAFASGNWTFSLSPRRQKLSPVWVDWGWEWNAFYILLSFVFWPLSEIFIKHMKGISVLDMTNKCRLKYMFT